MDVNAPAQIDTIFKGEASGNVAKRLLANGFNPAALRTNDVLKYEEWIQIDAAVNKAVRSRLVIVGDLISRGLVLPISNGLGKTVLAFQTESDMSAAEISLDGVASTVKDRPLYATTYLPLPIIHKDFEISARNLQSSRAMGDPLDTTGAEIAGAKVAECIEDLFLNGTGGIVAGGGTIYGMYNYTNVNSTSNTVHWDHSAATGATIVADVRRMKAAALADGYGGPFGLLIPTAYESALDGNYSDYYPGTIRQRILAIDNIVSVRVADKLTADHVLLYELQNRTMRAVIGMQPTTLQWDSHGGLLTNYKVMAIMIPNPRADQSGKCGIVAAT